MSRYPRGTGAPIGGALLLLGALGGAVFAVISGLALLYAAGAAIVEVVWRAWLG